MEFLKPKLIIISEAGASNKIIMEDGISQTITEVWVSNIIITMVDGDNQLSQLIMMVGVRVIIIQDGGNQLIMMVGVNNRTITTVDGETKVTIMVGD